MGLAALTVGCFSSLYPGPRRPASEIATIASRETSVVSIDGVSLPGGTARQYDVLPGAHRIEVTLSQYRVFYSWRSRPLERCLIAKKGRTYLTVPFVEGRLWQPQIVDQSTGRAVDFNCPEHITLLVYPGPRRADDQVAILSPDGLMIDAIDERHLTVDALEFKVAPGGHRVSVYLLDHDPVSGPPRFDRRLVTGCFSAEAAHRYSFTPEYTGAAKEWRPRLIDETASRSIDFRPASVSDPACSPPSDAGGAGS